MATGLVYGGASNEKILLAMGINAKRMMQYEWKQRITVVRKGNPTEPIVDQVRFDASGQMQRATISAPEQKQMGGIRGKIAAEVKENVKEIMTLAGQYNKPQQLVEAVKKASVSEDAATNTTVLQAGGLIESGDSVIMRLDSSTHLARHIDIQTHYQGSPMTIAEDFTPTPEGPNLMKSMKVAVPQKGLAINVDSYDFVKQSER